MQKENLYSSMKLRFQIYEKYEYRKKLYNGFNEGSFSSSLKVIERFARNPQ